MKTVLPAYPINAVLPKIIAGLQDHQLVILTAEPGSGKTTIAPLALLDEPWLDGRKILMLEPRRLAARMAAERMSVIAMESVGETIGYRVRFDTRVSGKTRIEVVTEGVFLRMIQNDPGLSDVGLIIFDEFHERSLNGDLALAFCRDLLELNDALKVMLMSATINGEMVLKSFDDALLVSGKGRCYPVLVTYLERKSSLDLIAMTVSAVRRALNENRGDILVFLPGAGEIEQVKRRLKGMGAILPLYGDLPQEQQDKVFRQCGERRIILSTPIAETSITIEGISVVIDSGLMKRLYYSPSNGLSTLVTVPVSKASAEQRAGRGGRLGPGVCYRLWTEGEHFSRPDFMPPEILHADLCPLLLEVMRWGVNDPGELQWIDPPRQGRIEEARDLLVKLGAIDCGGKLSRLGQKTGMLPLHPRLAVMLLKGRELGLAFLACQLAAILQNRDPIRSGTTYRSCDIEDRLDLLRMSVEGRKDSIVKKGGDPGLCRRIITEARQYHSLVGGKKDDKYTSGAAGILLAFAYPDRIARRTGGPSVYLLASGRRVELAKDDQMQNSEFLVAAQVDGGVKNGRIFLAAPITMDDLNKSHRHLIVEEKQVVWRQEKAEAIKILALGRIEISRLPPDTPDHESLRNCLLAAIRDSGGSCLPWDQRALELRRRLVVARSLAPDEWPDYSDEALMGELSWLTPYLGSATSFKELRQLDLHSVLMGGLSWKQQQKLEKLLPTHYLVPSGSRIRLKYKGGNPPVLAVRLQEMFGAIETPALFEGKLPVLVHLLSPAGRPVQVTGDLASFWKNTYPEVRKELAGRYPKHHWPENPLQAVATARCKKRR